MIDLEKLKDERGYLPFPLSDRKGNYRYPTIERDPYGEYIMLAREATPQEKGIATLAVTSPCGNPTDTWNETIMALIKGFNKEDNE